ncbi:MAG: hypothetical protein HY332_15540 [Chloroflexi bacterium]|nr:hypothetical protein [Chloroflexota bacterium]
MRVELEGYQVHEATVTLGPGAEQTLDVTLAPLLAKLQVRVADATTGRPIQGALVTCAAGDQLPCADYELLVPLKRSREYGAIRKRVEDLKPADAWRHGGLHFFSFALKAVDGIDGTSGHAANGVPNPLELSASASEPPVAVFAMYPGSKQPISAVVVSPTSDGKEPRIEDLRQPEDTEIREESDSSSFR